MPQFRVEVKGSANILIGEIEARRHRGRNWNDAPLFARLFFHPFISSFPFFSKYSTIEKRNTNDDALPSPNY